MSLGSVNWALALATDGGIADERSPSSAVSAVLLPAEAFSATLPAFRCAYFFEWFACPANLWSATGVPAVSDCAAAVVSSAAAACDGPAKHTKSPAARINAERPLALLIMRNLPNLPAPGAERRPRRVSAARQKKGIFGLHRAKAGQSPAASSGSFGRVSPAAIEPPGASGTDRCYEPQPEAGQRRLRFPDRAVVSGPRRH